MNFSHERNPLWILIDIAFIVYATYTGDSVILFFAILDLIYTLFWIFIPESMERFESNIFIQLLLAGTVIIAMLYILNSLLSNL